MAWPIGVALGLLLLVLVFLILPVSDWRALLDWLRGRGKRPSPLTPEPGSGAPDDGTAERPGQAVKAWLRRLFPPSAKLAVCSSIWRSAVKAWLRRLFPQRCPAASSAEQAASSGAAGPPPEVAAGRHTPADAQWAAQARGPERPPTVRRCPPDGRDWQEEPPAAPAGSRPWAEASKRVLERLTGRRDSAPQAAQAGQAAAKQVSAFSPGLVALVVVVLLAILVISLFPREPQEPPPAPPRGHHLTIVLAGLGEEGDTVVVTDDVSARERLRSGLQERLDSAGLGALATLRLVGSRPEGATAAYSLTLASQADLLLWGTIQEGRPRSVLTLTVVPHLDAETPEFEEYLRLMVTPRHFPLTRAGSAGLAAADLDRLLPWLAHFYLGEFDRIEGQSPQAMPLPTTAPELLTFHWAGLMWFKGDYQQAQDGYSRLVGARFVTSPDEFLEPPPLLVPETLSGFLAASTNNEAVVLLLREALGQVPRDRQRQAIELLEQAAGAAPDVAAPWYNLGRAYLAQRRWSEAVEALEKAVQLDGRHALALAALSEAYRGVGDAGQSKAYADQALRVYENLPEGHLALARYYLAQAKVEEAGKELERALNLAENEVRARRAREVAARGGPNPRLIRAEYLKAWGDRAAPLLAQIRLARANLLLLKAQIEGPSDFFDFLWTLLTGEKDTLGKALDEIDPLLKQYPNWYEAHCLRGEVLWARGVGGEALAALEQARNLDRQDVGAYLILARMHLERWRALRSEQRFDDAAKELAQAAQQYQALIDEGVAPARGYFGLGEIAREEKRWQDAVHAYDQAVRADRTYGEAYLRLGQAEYQSASDPSDRRALEALSGAVEHAGLQHWLCMAGHVERGEIFLEQYLRSKGEKSATDLLDAAEKEFIQAREAAKVQPFALRTDGIVILLSRYPRRDYAARALAGLGRVAFEREDYDGAVKSYQQALQEDYWNFAARYGLGRVHLVRRDSGAALPELEKAVQVDPRSISARYYLREAYYAQYREEEARAAGQRVADLCSRLGEQVRPRADDVEACGLFKAKQ